MADRAVSTVVGFVLALAITSLLVSGILIAAGDFVGDERERVVRSELEVVSQRLAADVKRADRLNETTGHDGAVRVDSALPPTVGGSGYTVAIRELSGPNSYRLRLSTGGARNVTVTTTIELNSELEEATLPGGDLVIVYRPASGGQLEVHTDD